MTRYHGACFKHMPELTNQSCIILKNIHKQIKKIRKKESYNIQLSYFSLNILFNSLAFQMIINNIK